MIRKITLLLLSVLFITVTSCSKDDSPETTPADANGGEVYTGQVVTINLPGVTLTQDQYEGKLGPYVTFFEKTGEHQLSFVVVTNVSPGVLDLVIPSLGVNISYEIKITTLEGTPEETIAPLLTNLTMFAQTLGESTSPEAENAENALQQFNTYLENASAEDKIQLALAYKANKTLIDNAINEDFSNITGRLTNSDKLILKKFFAAILTIDIGSTLAVRGWHPSVRVLGIVVAGIASAKTVDYYVQFIEVEARELGININSLSGTNDRNTNDTTLEFNSEVTAVFPITTSKRKVTAQDESSTLESVTKFFTARNQYNAFITKVNSVIESVNNTIPFVSFSLFDTVDLPASAPVSQHSANQEIFDNFQFTVNHPNLTLQQATLQANGEVAIKIKVVGTPAQLPVEATLNYSYSDDFNEYSGSFPIVVNVENPLIGTWTMVTFDNGIPVGQSVSTFSETCPGILAYKEFESGSFTFTETGFSYVWNNQIVMPQINYNPETCEIYSDNPDTTTNDSESGSGTYEFNGTSYILTYSEGDEQNTVQFINEDRIKIYDQEFVRN